MKSWAKKLLLSLALLSFIGVVTILVARYYLIESATVKAHEIFAVSNANIDVTILEITKAINANFQKHKDAQDDASAPLLMKFIKIPEGAIETLYARGWCDNAVRMEKFILSLNGLQSKQWDMVKPDAAHAALIVNLPDGKTIFSDPFHGIVVKDPQGNLAGPQESRVQFVALSDQSDLSFYKDLSNTAMGAQGEDLRIETFIGSPIILGEPDGSAEDVKNDAMKAHLSPHWNYMGHRYSRNWDRVLRATQPVRVSFLLAQNVDKGVITTNKAPLITGNTLQWNLEADEELVFDDGAARLSFWRMNSYIPVDQIIIEAR